MDLGLTQPVTEMSTRISPGSKGCRCVGLTTLPPSCVDWKSWEPQPPGALGAYLGLYRDRFFETTILKWNLIGYQLARHMTGQVEMMNGE